MTAEILSVTTEGAAHRVIFRFVDGQTVLGPFVENRPADEDHQAWVNARIPQPQPDYYAVMQAALDSIAPGTYDAVRSALKDVDAESVNLGPVALSVTFPNQIDPDDVEAALRARVDSEQGAGVFDQVKATLRAMGFDSVTLERKSNLLL